MMQRTRIGSLALAAALGLATTTTLYGQDRDAPRDAGARQQAQRGQYDEAKMAELPGPAQRAIQKHARGADEVRVWKVTRPGQDEEMYEAAFPNKEGVRMVMKVDKTGRVVVPPTELPEEDQKAESRTPQEIQHVDYEDLPRGARQALGEEAEGAQDVDYMRVMREGNRDQYIVHYTKDGRRQQLWADVDGKIISGPKPTRYQPEDRDATARDRDRDRDDDRARPAAARTGADRQSYLQIAPVNPTDVPNAVEQSFRREADQNFERAEDVAAFRLADGDYALQFTRDGKRMGMRVDREGKVVSELREIDKQARDPEHPEREFFAPIDRGTVPAAVQRAFEEKLGTDLGDTRDPKYYRVGGDDYVILWAKGGQQQGIRFDRDGTVVTGPYEVREAGSLDRK
jgi:hypothetical protein